MTPAIAAVIVNYNAGEELRLALQSVAHAVGRSPWEGVVIDNASTDGSAAIAREFEPHVRLVRNGENVGFARAVNQGIAATRAPGVLIMNPDCRLDAGAIEILLAELNAHPSCAIVGPRILDPDGSVHDRRENANGVDLNRNYPARNYLPGDKRGQRPLDQPEAKALHDLVLEERPHLVVVAHAWRNDQFVNFDGPAQRHAELFAQRAGWRVKPSDKIAPTPGSLGSWVGRTRGVPILTLEYERGTDPLTAWLDTRAAILAVVMADR
jgi:glycosyltransferase involved in cell wall biosynthesis